MPSLITGNMPIDMDARHIIEYVNSRHGGKALFSAFFNEPYSMGHTPTGIQFMRHVTLAVAYAAPQLASKLPWKLNSDTATAVAKSLNNRS